MSRSVWLLAGGLLVAGLAAGCGGGSRCGPGSGLVARVIDGDTIELEDGQRVRYLLVDAPESTGGHVDCFGPEAAAYNQDLVGGRRVSLAYDVECRDRYERLLAWVSVDGVEVNSRLVEQGYACAYYIPPNGEQRQIEFQTLEAEARAAQRGMWGECSVVSCDR